ncbi:hypothetical protein LTR08_007735 [Meristemomyces frigidus]|nr:hypothetical protein LTR08_007735 [Meristemomyces frigidus]
MATTNGRNGRTSYMPLAVHPVKDNSLTSVTSLDSPPVSPATSIRPPTPGRGPLTSHPTTPDDMSGAFPPTPGPERAGAPRIHTSNNNNNQQASNGGFRIPSSPASAALSGSPPEPQRRSSGVRKLLSLSSLRSSFSSSRTSLSVPRASNEIPQQHTTEQYSPSQYTPSQYTASINRPSSPSAASTTASSHQSRPALRSKKSASWFRRKSAMFMTNGDALDAVDENTRPETRDSSKRGRDSLERPETRESKRLRTSSPAPSLGAIDFSGTGEIGWDEQLFTR